MNGLFNHTGLPRFFKFLADYVFLLLMLVGIAVNYYFEMKVNRAIKRYTANQEQIVRFQQYSAQLSQLNRRLTSLESNVRNFGLTGNEVFIKNHASEAESIIRESVLVADNLRPLATPQMLDAFKKSVREKASFESRLIYHFRASGAESSRSLIETPESILSSERFNMNASVLAARVNKEILALNKTQDREKLDIISLDYAMPHLTSFIFFVIALYVLYKILQVYRLNKDLNKAVHNEQQAQLIKDQFMDNMTHELRSPLNSVLGYTALLLKSPLKNDQQKFVRAIRTSGELLLNVINEVLDYSKIKSGYIHFADEPFSLQDQFTALADIVNDKLEEKQLYFETFIDPTIPTTLRGDASKLLQVLLNLTFNAIKFTSHGRISVMADNMQQASDKTLVRFTVSDTGIGIPPEKLPYIFDRFYQVQDGVRSKYGGTGLGLSITKQIVTLQGGQIRAESEPGRGTSFIFELAFAHSHEPVRNESSAPGQDSVLPGDPVFRKRLPAEMRILVVDDNALNRELASFMLKDMGVRFKTVNSGQEALDILKTEAFDAVLMDVQMPVMDGRDTARRIRTQLGLQVPVIALTAFSQEKEKKRCADAGMNGYLSKPFKEKDLFEVLEPFAPEEILLEKQGAVDVQHLKNIARDNQEFIDTVILRIAETLPEEVATLRKSIMDRDYERTNQLSHDMKTTFAVLGMTTDVQEALHYLESWTGNHRSEAKVLRMLQIVEAAGAEATIQILENFSSQQGTN